MEPAGDDPGQGHQAQAGGGVAAEPAAGGRRAVAATPAPVAVAAVPERGRPAAVGAAGRRPPAARLRHRQRRLRRVPGARGDRETRTGRAARPGHRNGSGEPVQRRSNPPTARRTQGGRVREQGARRTAVRRQVAVGRRRHSRRDGRGEKIVI